MPGKAKNIGQQKRKSWDEAKMEEAITAVREKRMGFLKAAKFFDVPRTTLFRLASKSDVTPPVAAKTKLGRKTILPPDIERDLVDYCLMMEQKFFGLTRSDVRNMAYQLAVSNNIPNPFGVLGTAGKGWLKLFLRRHKSVLTFRKPTATSFCRALGFNKDSVGQFFDFLKKK